MPLLSLTRTATPSFSPHTPQICLGTVAGTMDASFSSTTQLEIFNIDSKTPLCQIQLQSRFCKLEWSAFGASKSGTIIGGMESGELFVWDPKALIENRLKESLLARKEAHRGPVKALCYNPLEPHRLATGSLDAEICLWDLANNLAQSSPAPRKSNKLDEVTSLAWNTVVPHILASGSSNGMIVIWDVRTEKEIICMNTGHRTSVSSLAWNPEIATQLMTVSDDDQRPVIKTWDLRNAHAAQSVFSELEGHTKSPLALAWNPRDVELLLSTGKDNRTILWNPCNGSLTGELPKSDSWVFEVKWSPMNPELIATASFDGTVKVHTIGTTNGAVEHVMTPISPSNDPFANLNPQSASASTGASLVLPQPPKWLRRPCGAVFGFGSKLATFAFAKAGSTGHTITPTVKIRTMPGNQKLAARISELEHATDSTSLREFCQSRLNGGEGQVWEYLKILNGNEAREELIAELGVQPSEDLSDVLARLELQYQPSEPIQTNEDEFSQIHRKIAEPFELGTDEITGSLLVGDWTSAVVSALRQSPPDYASALVLASMGGGSLFARVQELYCKSQAAGKPYLRLVSNIMKYDLADIVENADELQWKTILGLICTYARSEDFGSLCGLLADRMRVENESVLVYMLAGNFDRVVEIWSRVPQTSPNEKSWNSIEKKGLLLQQLIEKITVLSQSTGASCSNSMLDESLVAYAELSATEGFLGNALKYINMVSEERNHPLKERLWKSDVPLHLKNSIPQPILPFQIVEVSMPAVSQQSWQAPVPNKNMSPYKPQGNPNINSAPNAYTQPNNMFNQYPAQSRTPNPYQPIPNNMSAPTSSAQQQPPPPMHQQYQQPIAPSVYPQANSNKPMYNSPLVAQPVPTHSNSYSQPPQHVFNPMGANTTDTHTQQYNPAKGLYSQGIVPTPPPIHNDAAMMNAPRSSSAAPTNRAAGNWNDPPMVAPKRPVNTGPSRPPSTMNQPFANAPVNNAQSTGPQMGQANATGYYPNQQQPQQQQAQYNQQSPNMYQSGQQSNMQHSHPPMQSPIAQAPPPPPPVARHPAGDQSHIPPQQRPIVTSLTAILGRCKNVAQANQKRMVDDAERRFNNLFDRLNNEEVNEAVIALLLDIAQGISSRDLNAVSNTVLRGMTSNANDESLIGLKRVVEMAQRMNI